MSGESPRLTYETRATTNLLLAVIAVTVAAGFLEVEIALLSVLADLPLVALTALALP